MGQGRQKYLARQAAAAAPQSYKESQSSSNEGENRSSGGLEWLQDPSVAKVQVAPETQHIWDKLLVQRNISDENLQKLADLMKLADGDKRTAAQRGETDHREMRHKYRERQRTVSYVCAKDSYAESVSC